VFRFVFCRLQHNKGFYFQITAETNQNASFVVWPFYFLPVKGSCLLEILPFSDVNSLEKLLLCNANRRRDWQQARSSSRNLWDPVASVQLLLRYCTYTFILNESQKLKN